MASSGSLLILEWLVELDRSKWKKDGQSKGPIQFLTFTYLNPINPSADSTTALYFFYNISLNSLPNRLTFSEFYHFSITKTLQKMGILAMTTALLKLTK